MPWSQSGPKNNPRCPSECKSRFQSQRNGKSPVLMTEVWERRMQVQRSQILLRCNHICHGYWYWIWHSSSGDDLDNCTCAWPGDSWRRLQVKDWVRARPGGEQHRCWPSFWLCHLLGIFFISNFVYVIFWPVGIFIIYVIFLAEQSMVAIRFKLTRSRTISRRTHVVTLSSLSS